MSIPTVVFLDTSVLTGQQFNFASTALTTFVLAARNAGLQLLLPDPTEREIQRQIQERSREALDALEVARKRAPFLTKWTSFPNKSKPSLDTWEVTQVAAAEWNEFLSQFTVIRPGYEFLDIKMVMDWYDQISAPFREGKKRKEFPDAFAISIVDTYARRNRCFVAVVSEDQDFKLACERFPNLLYFKSLPRLTEVLLSSEENIGRLRAAIDANIGVLEAVISGTFGGLKFRHYDRRFDINQSRISEPAISDLNIVAIGENECTITFDFELEAQHELTWEDYNGPEQEPDRFDEWVIQRDQVSGTAKLLFDQVAGTLMDVTYACLDGEDIEVISTPRRW